MGCGVRKTKAERHELLVAIAGYFVSCNKKPSAEDLLNFGGSVLKLVAVGDERLAIELVL
jgi:hypothetical protein